MHILVINSGSSSIKFSIFKAPEDGAEPNSLLEGQLSGIGKPEATLQLGDASSVVAAATPREAIGHVFAALSTPGTPPVEAVGYRVVHPGPNLTDHQRITPAVLRDLKEAIPFAPLHDPAVLEVIREGMNRFPAISHYACFDTVFHRTMPVEATTYPIAHAMRNRGVRRYGFHGLSCESVVYQLRSQAGELPSRLVIAHLGSGCSVTAVLDGASVDTSMGLTPTGGVVMGTRPGDLDPGLVLFLLRQQTGGREAALAAVETMLNHDAGLVALSGMPNDVKAVRAAAAAGDEHAILALKVFTRSVTKAIGAFAWILGGLDAIAFAGGIAEHDPKTRAEILHGLEALGVSIDATLNEARSPALRRIAASDSKTQVFIVPAQEDHMIAMHVSRMARSEA